MPSQRDHSRMNWNSGGTMEEINAGSLQRIADAAEKMAGNYIQLQNERDRYENYYRAERETNAKLYRKISSLRGVITRQKNKLAGK